jgi:hypothetical protein
MPPGSNSLRLNDQSYVRKAGKSDSATSWLVCPREICPMFFVWVRFGAGMH